MSLPSVSSRLLLQLEQYIHANELFVQSDKILVAISGGPDSVFLAYALRELGYSIALAHVNYHLRGNASNSDAALVASYANSWQVPLFQVEYNTLELLDAADHKYSLQEFARKLRYDFFEEILRDSFYDYCATAHHADDQLETLLISFFSGTGPGIWKGIPLKRDDTYVRPLLFASKNEIEAALHELGLAYAVDASNLKDDYLRNKVRHALVPAISAIFPSFHRVLLDKYSWTSKLDQGKQNILEEIALSFGDHEAFDFEVLKTQYADEAAESILVHVFEKWGLYGTQIREALKLCEAMPGKYRVFPDFILYKTRKGFARTPLSLAQSSASLVIYSLEYPCSFHLNACKITLRKCEPTELTFADGLLAMDQDKLSFPLVIRPWKEGDKMIPLGMKSGKKLSDIFIDNKFETAAKEKALVVLSGNKIVGLSSFRISDEVKISGTTRSVLLISFEDLNETGTADLSDAL